MATAQFIRPRLAIPEGAARIRKSKALTERRAGHHFHEMRLATRRTSSVAYKPSSTASWIVRVREYSVEPRKTQLSRTTCMKTNVLAVVGHIGPTASEGPMSAPHALAALAALGQPTRLEIFRLLIRREPDGLLAGKIAEIVGCAHNTLSSHLAILARAGLIRATRDGRSINYRVDVSGMRSLLEFLVTDCCDGHPELCGFSTRSDEKDCGCGTPSKSKRRK
jgi:ArsR family transcriptional regulator, arsenate/arsenite/antimonite-responsive transcriptional repressor